MPNPTLTLRAFHADDNAECLTLSVHDQQKPFVGDIRDLLAASSPTRHPFVMDTGNALVGFFHIDIGYADEYTFAPPGAHGLRAFFVDQSQQGKGYAQQALARLPGLMQTHFPEARQLVLTVNCKNPVAYQLYIKAGFADTGKLYLGGDAGPQHILIKEL